MTNLLLCAGLALAGLGPTLTPADETYFVLVFGSQRPGVNLPGHAHSFATFVRVTGDPCRADAQVEAFTISWLPATLDVRPLALHPECGVNLDLPTTLKWAQDDGQRVSLFGPFQIQKCCFDRARAKFAQLNSGAVLYKAADLNPDDNVSNCIQALADVVDGPRLRIYQSGWGESASYFISRLYLPCYVDPCRTHDWLVERLVPACACVRRLCLEDGNPTGHRLLRCIQNVRQHRLP